MDNPACDRCKFWEPVNRKGHENEGVCRRNAPLPYSANEERIVAALGHIFYGVAGLADLDTDYADEAQDHITKNTTPWAFWPVTMDVEWCGEFVNKLAA